MLNRTLTRSAMQEIMMATFILMYCLAYPCLLSDLTRFSLAWKAFSLLCLLLFVKKYKPTRTSFQFIMIYSLFLAYAYVLIFFSDNMVGALNYTSKYFAKVGFLFILLTELRPEIQTDRVVRIFVGFMTLIALHSLVFFALFEAGYRPSFYFTETWGMWSPFWGNFTSAANGTLRISSFFREPSWFASFMEFAVWTQFGYYMVTKRLKYGLAFLICLTTIAFTFSLASYISIIVTATIYVAYFNRHRIQQLGTAKLAFLSVLVAITVYHIGQREMDKFREAYYNQSRSPTALEDAGMFTQMLGRYGDPRSVGVKDRLNTARNDWAIFTTHPFGTGIIDPDTSSSLQSWRNISPSAPILWLTWTGWVGLILVVSPLLFAWFKLILKYVKDPKDIRCYISLGFVSQIVHHINAGTWMEPYFFFGLAVLIVSEKNYFVIPLRVYGRRALLRRQKMASRNFNLPPNAPNVDNNAVG